MKEIKLNVTLQYNPETDTIESYKVTLDGVANKTTKTSKVSKPKNQLAGMLVVREEAKLIISEELLTALDAKPDDKIAVVYKHKDGKHFPCIIKDDSGNRLTKTGTVQYRGKNNETLAAFGETFFVKQLEDGTFLMMGDVAADLDIPVKKAVEEISMSIETLKDSNYEIEDLTDSDLFTL